MDLMLDLDSFIALEALLVPVHFVKCSANTHVKMSSYAPQMKHMSLHIQQGGLNVL